MKKLVALLAVSVGCGGQDDAGLYVYGQNSETYLVGARGGTAQWGVQTGSTNQHCVSTAPSQVCVIPKTKDIKLKVESASAGGAAPQTDLDFVKAKAGNVSGGWFKALVDAGLDVSAEPWTYADVTSSAGAPYTIVVDASNAGFCGSGNHTTNEITKYACITGFTSGTTTLTNDSGVVGTYVKTNGTPACHLDIGALRAKGATAAEDNNLIRHAVYSCMFRMAGGVGNNGTGNARCSSSTINSLTKGSSCIVSANEACIMSSFGEMGDTTHFGIVSSAGCGT